jgi:predicted dehydrogenase
VTAQPAARLRIGVIGTGLIAQVMHLHYLAELADRFEVAAVCDIAEDSARACAERYGIPAVFTDADELLRHPLDAVMVLTSGSHAPIAVAAARAGLHVFVEKPMCFSVGEGRAMVAAAEQADVTLMVGYPKRYDPAFARLRAEAGELAGARLLRVTTLESPLAPYVQHYRLLPRSQAPAALTRRLREDRDARVRSAIGQASGLERHVYEMVLLDTLVHELNTVRGLLGEPDRLEYVSLAEQTVTVMLRFGDLPAAIHWIDLPGIARYEMEFALYAPDRRACLSFPSPFLRNEPAVLEISGGDPGTARSWQSREVLAYESGFKAELEAFHECVVTGTTPATSGRDGLSDIALCEAIIECHRTGRPVDNPAGNAGAGEGGTPR